MNDEPQEEISRVWIYENFDEPHTREDYRAVLSYFPLLSYTVRYQGLQLIELFSSYYNEIQLPDIEALNVQSVLSAGTKIILEIIDKADMVLVPREEYQALISGQ